MGATQTTSMTQKEILTVIKERQDNMVEDIKEIKTSVKSLDDCQRQFQLVYTEEHERVVSSATLAHKRIDEVLFWKAETEKRIKAIEDALIAQKTMNAILVFVATVLGGAVIMYIWDMLVQ